MLLDTTLIKTNIKCAVKKKRKIDLTTFRSVMDSKLKGFGLTMRDDSTTLHKIYVQVLSQFIKFYIRFLPLPFFKAYPASSLSAVKGT